MSVTWANILAEIQIYYPNVLTNTSLTESNLLAWANREVINICQEMDIRDHLVSSGSNTVTFTTSDLSKTLPANWLKRSDRFTQVRGSATPDDEYIEIIGLEELLAKDPDHDETTTGNPDFVAFEGNSIYVYPKNSATLTIEGYFRKPTDMTVSGSTVDLPWDTNLLDLITAGVMKKIYGSKAIDFDLMAYHDNQRTNYLELYRTHLNKNNSRQVQEVKYY